ncbi:hypothetical protein WJ542_05460 [Paraburkholderia sp. B3]|uniref:hypothetical protein n=1 Tax=Paraburkholderia sp. B3 TaxID=3134791 RepID=UPI003982657C
MTPPEYIPPILPWNNVGLATHVDRHLAFRIDPDTILDGPEMSRALRLEQFVCLALEATTAPFHAGSDPRKFVYTQNQFDSAARKLAAMLPFLMADITILNPSGPYANQFLFAPHLRLLGEVFFSSDISGYRGDAKCQSVEYLDSSIAESYNDFVASFRQIMHARKLLRRELHNWSLGSCENVANLNTYLQDFFSQHDSVTVLHLRLSHVKATAGWVAVPMDDQRRDLELLRKSRALFFDRLRRKPALFTAAPGYVWAIIPTVDGCYELHLTLLFSSAALQKVLDDIDSEAAQRGGASEDHADLIGAYWVRIATDGRGTYRRGDWIGRLYDPRQWVHGDVRADDVCGREKLRETLGYFACRRALVRLENEPAGEYFGIPERKTRGARRSVRGRVGCTE